MTGDESPEARNDERRSCVVLANCILVGLGVACVAGHLGLNYAMRDPAERHEWDGLAIGLLAIPSVLIGVTLAVAAFSAKVVPKGLRVAEFVLLALIAAGLAAELLAR